MHQLIDASWLESYNGTVKPVYKVALGHLDELQKAEIISNSKLVPSVFIKIHYWINHR